MFTVTREQLDGEIAMLTDHFTDELFHLPGARVVRFSVSRFVVDPERFESDNDELMTKRGMGVLYTNGVNGTRVRRDPTESERKNLFGTYYHPHHQRLATAVTEALAQHGQALIVDAHSFPPTPLPCDLNQDQPRPDICLGTDPFHTPKALTALASAWWRDHGFSVGVDWPYSGSIVPIERLQCDSRVRSMMVEVNRRLYMRLTGKIAERSPEFNRMRTLMTKFLSDLVAADLAEPSDSGRAVGVG
jgi:N-formylglutamate amidohydrolase